MCKNLSIEKNGIPMDNQVEFKNALSFIYQNMVAEK